MGGGDVYLSVHMYSFYDLLLIGTNMSKEVRDREPYLVSLVLHERCCNWLWQKLHTKSTAVLAKQDLMQQWQL